jgi:YesN/AraC family two-component response regulator
MVTPPPKQYYRLKVLIADDILEARRGTRLMLAMHPGVEVIAIAQNGQQAVELAIKHQPDIVLMDLNMPEMDGIAAMQQIRQARPEIIFIVISGEDDAKIKKAAIDAGALDFLQKPFMFDDLDMSLRRAARAWLARRQRAEQASRAPRTTPPDRETLVRLAQECSLARRTDDRAVAIYERLVSFPNCEPRWVMTLAMAYVIRQDWGKLKILAEKLEHSQSI